MSTISNGTLSRLNRLGLFYIGPHVPSSKNSRVKTSRGIFPSKATSKWRKESRYWWDAQRDQFLLQSSEPLIMGAHFIRKTKHKYDWVNPLQTIQDEMVAQGWITDDNVSKLIPIPFRINGEFSTVDPENSGVILKIMNNDWSVPETERFDLIGFTIT